MPKHSAAKRRARKEKCPGFLAEHVQPDPSQLSRQLGASSQAVLHLPTGAGARLPASGTQEPAVIRPNVSTCRDMGGVAGGCFPPGYGHSMEESSPPPSRCSRP